MDLKKLLEKEYFCETFHKIKSNLIFKDLNLTEEEIIKNRNKIKKILNCCSKNEIYCNKIKVHYRLYRNLLGDLILKIHECEKNKLFWEFKDNEVKDQIDKLLISNILDLTYSEIKNSLTKIFNLMQLKKNLPTSSKDLFELGILSENIENPYYLIKKENKKDFLIVLGFLSILKNEKILIISARNLKEKICNFFLNFQDKTQKNEKDFYEILNIKNLIIVDFGYEDYVNNVNYLLDYFVNVIENRINKKNKKTIIVTDLLFQNIENSIFNNKNFQKNDEISIEKLNKLKFLLNNSFIKKNNF